MKKSLFEKLIFLPVDIPNPPNVSEFWDTLEDKDLYRDDYRTCHHVPIMDRDGNFTEIGKQTPELIDWFENYVFNWAERSRVMIIRTEPRKHNAPHIDCSPSKFDTLQHKFRYVFQGKVETLYFIHKDGEARPKPIDKPYLMSGRWPHAMDNNIDTRKYTLALGAPWEPSLDDEKYFKIIKQSYEKYSDYFIDHSKWKLPVNWKNLFESKYENQLEHFLKESNSANSTRIF